MTTCAEILEALGGLTGEERNQIRGVLSLLAAGDAESTRGAQSAPEMVWNAVREVVGPQFPTYVGIRKTRYGKKVREGGELVSNYTTRFMPKLTTTERIAAYRHMIRSLLIWMDRAEIPITPGSVANSLPTLPEAVDRQFPGYAESGMLRFALLLDEKE